MVSGWNELTQSKKYIHCQPPPSFSFILFHLMFPNFQSHNICEVENSKPLNSLMFSLQPLRPFFSFYPFFQFIPIYATVLHVFWELNLNQIQLVKVAFSALLEEKHCSSSLNFTYFFVLLHQLMKPPPNCWLVSPAGLLWHVCSHQLNLPFTNFTCALPEIIFKACYCIFLERFHPLWFLYYLNSH